MKLHPIVSPVSDFEHAEKGDALYGIFFLYINKHELLSHIMFLIELKWFILIYGIFFSNGVGPFSGETYQREASKPSQSMLFPKLIHLLSHIK